MIEMSTSVTSVLIFRLESIEQLHQQNIRDLKSNYYRIVCCDSAKPTYLLKCQSPSIGKHTRCTTSIAVHDHLKLSGKFIAYFNGLATPI